MSSSEFSIALRYWLGIPLFRGNHLQSCTCRSPLDQHGDYLLGCGQGPLRIRRHDALCNIVYHALSQDNSSVRREERIWGDSRDRPGNIFHPDFDDCRPTYFDISVRHTLQPGNLNRASTNAGAAAVAGEMEKDQKHEHRWTFPPSCNEDLGRLDRLKPFDTPCYRCPHYSSERSHGEASNIQPAPATVSEVLVIQCQDVAAVFIPFTR